MPLRAGGRSFLVIGGLRHKNAQQSAHESRSTERMNGLSFLKPRRLWREGRSCVRPALEAIPGVRATEIACGLDVATVNGESS